MDLQHPFRLTNSNTKRKCNYYKHKLNTDYYYIVEILIRINNIYTYTGGVWSTILELYSFERRYKP
jgi:hypothetical protein